MIDWSKFPPEILPLLKSHNVMKSVRRQPKIYQDTSNFTQIDYGDIIQLGDEFFLIVGYTREGRFGIDDQPKQWVPKVYNLLSGERYIIKLVFYETYEITFRDVRVTCYRSPEKEAKVINLVQDNPCFMQGRAVLDSVGNVVRILDPIRGKRLDRYAGLLGDSHQDYFENHVKHILERFLTTVDAIIFLHQHGFKHGDVRRDHIFVDNADGHFQWIDFDYDFHLPERPFALDLFGLGNILLFILGQQNFRPADILHNPKLGNKVFDKLTTADLSMLSQDRIFNLSKIFPYIPKALNDILIHFSAGTKVMYDSVSEFRDDLATALLKIT